MLIKEVEIAEVCDQLPSIQSFIPQQDYIENPDHLFICACGFEERSLAVPSRFLISGEYTTSHSILFEHETNRKDNESNLPKLTECLNKITQKEIYTLSYREEDFIAKLVNILDNTSVAEHELLRVSIDISALTSQMLLSTLRLLLERRLKLRILYTEATIYHPTLEEYEKSPQDWTIDGAGMSKGILQASESRLYASHNLRELPTLLVAFPTFKPERIRSIQAELQPARTEWVLGIPHAPHNKWRTNAMRQINEVSNTETTHEILTFSYSDSLSLLEHIYRANGDDYHIVVAPHGSKLQNIGVALLCLIRQDVGLWFSTPKSFNPMQYTEGVEALWEIDIENTQQLVDTVRSCGKLELKPNYSEH